MKITVDASNRDDAANYTVQLNEIEMHYLVLMAKRSLQASSGELHARKRRAFELIHATLDDSWVSESDSEVDVYAMSTAPAPEGE